MHRLILAPTLPSVKLPVGHRHVVSERLATISFTAVGRRRRRRRLRSTFEPPVTVPCLISSVVLAPFTVSDDRTA